MSKLYRFDYLSGEITGSYNSIKEAAKDNDLGYNTVWTMLQRDIIKYPRLNFYISDKPKPRWIIECYDNETRKLLGKYKTVKEAAKKTGVDWQQIRWQIAKDLPFNARRMGCTGLWYKRVTISN